MKKSTRNILIGTGIVAVGVAAVTTVSYNITKKLLKIAMDLETPDLMNKNREN